MKKILCLVVSVVACLFLVSVPVFADGGNCVSTSVLGSGGEVCDNGSGSSIWNLLRLVVDIMSIGVGILGVIGISVVGVQYLTSGGSEERATKAKRRMFEIVIGLVAYAVLFLLMSWLMPNFNVESAPSNIATLSNTKGTANSTGATGSTGTANSINSTYASGSAKTNTVNGSVKIVNGRAYDSEGKVITGAQKINGANYSFDKNGVMRTGWVTVTKDGKKQYYYYYRYGKNKGKQAFGTIHVKGDYNHFSSSDTWYLSNKTGVLQGVDLSVPRIAQTVGTSCGPTAVLMIRAYFIGRQSYSYNGYTYPWNADVPWNHKCGEAEIFPNCVKSFGYTEVVSGEYKQTSALRQLFAGRPFIFRWYGSNAVNYGYAGGWGGHFMVISGYRNGVFTIKDPAGSSVPRKSSISESLFVRYWPTRYLTFYYPIKMS